MRIKLNAGVEGAGSAGEVVDLDDAEAQRLIDAGRGHKHVVTDDFSRSETSGSSDWQLTEPVLEVDDFGDDEDGD